MEIFNFFGVLLLLLLASNIINKFLPNISVPLIQLVLGALVTILLTYMDSFKFEFVLDPDLFFIAFLAPLIYYEGTMLDMKAMMKSGIPILNSAITLVIITVFAVGFLLHLLIPSIPLLIAFILIAALAPTDSVSVMAVSKRVPVPPKLMNILSGESVMNDASGITSFQFALVAATTGMFSFSAAIVQFLVLWLGGILTGVAFVLIKYVLIILIRDHGAENVTFRILIRLLTPFIVFVIAESIGVSGILAVLSAGITHSIVHRNYDPSMANFNVANQNVWSTFAFALEGLVFLMLGTQLPTIIRSVRMAGQLSLTLYAVFILTVVFVISRFLWWCLTVKKSSYQEEDRAVGRLRSATIFSLAGARGTVTLASVMSIPVFLSSSTTLFPQRELLIAIASGVIIVSMLITNFLLPKFVESVSSDSEEESERKLYIDILNQVITRLENAATPTTNVSTSIVVKTLYERIELHMSLSPSTSNRKRYIRITKPQEDQLLIETFQWQHDYVSSSLKSGYIDEQTAIYYLNRLSDLNNSRFIKHGVFVRTRLILAQRMLSKNPPNKEEFKELRLSVSSHIIERLLNLKDEYNFEKIDHVISFYRIFGNVDPDGVTEVALNGFQIERELIQEAFDTDKICTQTKREMLRNILLLEDELKIKMT